MAHHYEYQITGRGAGDVHFTTTGRIFTEFAETFQAAMERSFEDLTDGKAVYGNPGKGGCHGPYEISEVVIRRVPNER